MDFILYKYITLDDDDDEEVGKEGGRGRMCVCLDFFLNSFIKNNK